MSDETMKAIVQALLAAPSGFANGARSFGDRAKWGMGAYGDVPYPAPYDGGPAYPAKDDANAYVRNNFPMGSVAVVPQPQIVEQPIRGPIDLMPVRTPEDQAQRDRIFADPRSFQRN